MVKLANTPYLNAPINDQLLNCYHGLSFCVRLLYIATQTNLTSLVIIPQNRFDQANCVKHSDQSFIDLIIF